MAEELIPTDLAITAFWGPRAETAEGCARRLVATLHRITDVDRAIERWIFARDSPHEPKLEATVAVDELAEIMERSRPRRDDNMKVIPDLGFVIGLDGERIDGARLTLSVRCGLQSGPILNAASLEPSVSYTAAVSAFEWCVGAVEALIDAFDPDWARVDSVKLLRKRSPSERLRPAVGWMLYLRHAFDCGRLPPKVWCKSFNGGMLVASVQDTFDAERPEHRAAAASLDGVLRHMRAI